jgi:hypothetical protein
MKDDRDLEALFRNASAYRFLDFEELFADLTPHFSPAELREACLMRAQIKLFAADATLLDDLQKAGRDGPAPRFPCLNGQWLPDSPNRFVVFSRTPDALRDFVRILPRVGEALEHWYGETGAVMVRQLHSEILYFSGDFAGALRLAEDLSDGDWVHRADVLLALHVRFRCCLGAGRPEEAERCMLDMIRVGKAHPACLASYLAIRDWANLTTGWSGDTPRFCDAPDGDVLPVLDDRLTAIRRGISRLSPREESFAAYAARGYAASYTMRRFYMDIFHAIYWFQAGERGEAEAHFQRACRVSLDSGLLMPFAEYGGQILPLLRSVAESGTSCSHDWLATVTRLAERYEESLRAYRA